MYAYATTTGALWGAFTTAMYDSVDPLEIDEEMFDYWLDVLPPVFMRRTVQLDNGDTVIASFGFAEGDMTPIAFYKEGGKFYCCRIRG